MLQTSIYLMEGFAIIVDFSRKVLIGMQQLVRYLRLLISLQFSRCREFIPSMCSLKEEGGYKTKGGERHSPLEQSALSQK